MLNKTHNKLDSFYSKILLYITITIVSTIFLTSSVLYMSFENIGLSLIHSSVKDSLGQISYSTTYMANAVKTLALQVYFDQDISKLLLFDSCDVHTEYEALNKLSNYVSKTQFIHSIYLYNGNSQSVYSSTLSGQYTKASFPDREAIKLLDNSARYKKLSPIPRMLYDDIAQIGKGYYANVYTFIFYENISTNSKIERAVILNVTEGWMREIMDSLETTPDSKTFIIDNKGVIVNSIEKGRMLEDISGSSYIKKILEPENSSGYLVDDVDNVKSLITYVSSPNIGWKFIRITPYDHVIKKINKLKYNTLLICIIILIFGTLVSVFISRILYKPYSVMIERLKSLQSEKYSSSNVLRQEFLRNVLLNNTDYRTLNFNKRLADLKLNINFNNPFIVMLAKIDEHINFCNKYNVSDRNLFKFGVMNIASELFGSKHDNECVDMLDDHIVVIANISSELNSDTYKDINTIIKDVQHEVKKHLDISLSFAVSSAGSCIDKVNLLYSESLDTCNYFLFKESQCTIWSKDISKLEPAVYVYPSQKESLIVDALMLRKLPEATEIYMSIVNGTTNYSYSVFHTTILRLSLAISMMIDSLKQNSNILIPYSFNSFSINLSKMETVDDINNCFFELFELIIEKLDERQNMKYDVLVSNILDIINNNYMDQNLSIDSIADKVNMSATYMGRLFKKLTSKSISEIITEIRMEKAKELLKTTSMSVSEIVEKVGFSSSAYFYPLFKKMNGVTPNDYRQNISNTSST